jgi:hypothetical protein
LQTPSLPILSRELHHGKSNSGEELKRDFVLRITEQGYRVAKGEAVCSVER